MNVFHLSATIALQLGALLASIGIFVKILEELANYRHFADDGILAWKVMRLVRKGTSVGFVASVLDAIFYPTRYAGIMICALICSMSMPLTMLYSPLLQPLTLVVLAVLMLMHVRSAYGMDGADQMNIVVLSAVFASTFAEKDSFGQYACVGFVAIQSCLSYVIAGIAKLVSPVWRSGAALPGIFSTDAYGDKFAYALVKDHPRLSCVMCWTVMLWESTFPIVFFVPLPVAVGILSVGVLFHVANAVFMGLNDFFWAFCAAYPAVLFCSQHWI